MVHFQGVYVLLEFNGHIFGVLPFFLGNNFQDILSLFSIFRKNKARIDPLGCE